jgi:hypothetical protein
MTLLPLDPDELLSTTRAVRKRLDLDTPVPRKLIRESVCCPRRRWHKHPTDRICVCF